MSLLIPARDEAHNIDRCLTDLIGQDYPDYEIIVLDDHSKDNTADIVRGYANQYHHVKLLAGKSLPSGWTGKNWACQQLSEAAGGGFFIFTDADNRYATNAIKNTMGWMQKLNLGFLSAFPQQFTGTLMEKLVIPVIDIFVYGTLPLWMTYYLRSPLFAAANGQWLAFTREAYHRIGGHQGVRNQVVEDVEISRLVKRSGIKMLTTAGTG
ncbi:glycosyltransferase, partial [Candidatus Saccharibacteria bacterium]|nr:glycosyltransferase [Candidatus Saccharibacteria bacterium]NIW80227.1 glycosyltransferase [Calditrichia bacterium]